MTDLIGLGSNATNVVTTRPADTRIFGLIDTWVRDCSSPAAGDGTRIPAGFLNGLLAQVRQAIRQAGVSENNADDLMLWKAMRAAVDLSGLIVHRGTGAGTADALTATVAPAVTGYADGDIYEIAPVANSISTTPTLAVSGLVGKTIVHADGSPLLPGELIAGAPVLFSYRTALDKIVLLGATKSYVDAKIAGLVTPAALTAAINDAHLFATSGYQRLPSGLILQWAVGATDAAGITEYAQTITLPLAFPAACLFAQVSTKIAAADVGADYWYQVVSTSTTAAVVQLQKPPTYSANQATTPLLFALGY